jgi:hypothetical protein
MMMVLSVPCTPYLWHLNSFQLLLITWTGLDDEVQRVQVRPTCCRTFYMVCNLPSARAWTGLLFRPIY